MPGDRRAAKLNSPICHEIPRRDDRSLARSRIARIAPHAPVFLASLRAAAWATVRIWRWRGDCSLPR
jgi:hypothetical protein